MSNDKTIQQLDDTDSLCRLLKSIGNKNRLAILTLLLNGEASVGEMEKTLTIKQPNLSHELKKLRDLGLVNARRESKVIHYQIASEEFARFIRGVVDLAGIPLSFPLQPPQIDQWPVKDSGETTVIPVVRPLSRPRRQGEYGDFPLVRH